MAPLRFLAGAMVLGAASCAGATINDPWDREMRVVRSTPRDPALSKTKGPGRLSVTPMWARAGDEKRAAKTPPDERVASLPARSAGELTLSRSALTTVMAAGPQRFMSKVLLDPFFVDGRFVGFTLTRFYERDPRFSPVDLRRGDVVVRINGLPIGRPNEFMRAWDEVKTADEIRVEYLRGAEKRVLRVRIIDPRSTKVARPAGAGLGSGAPVDE